MTTPLFAGFEGALLHWNGHDTLRHTDHIPVGGMDRHYREALLHGVVGFRDTLPERYDVQGRWTCARRAVPPHTPIIWSMVHFDFPENPLIHAMNCAAVCCPDDRLIAVNEPSIGVSVSGRTREQATILAAAMMGSAIVINPNVRFWTCDPIHHLGDEPWEATDRLVDAFGDHIEVVGINYHAVEAQAPLHRILQHAQIRYPGHKIAITETSWHEGFPGGYPYFPTIHSRKGWWNHIHHEIELSGVPLAAVTWAPWLDMAWEPGPVWPNGWPG